MDRNNKLKDSFLRFFHDLFDLMVVNCLWLLCCLPVVTIGPATCGLYAVTLKLARQESVGPIKDFFLGFRNNFKPGLILGLLTTVLLAVSAGDIWFALNSETSLFLVVGIIMGAIAMILVSYGFALQTMFENPLKKQIQNAFKLAFLAPGKTIALWLILLIPVILAAVLPQAVMEEVGFLYLIVGFSGPVYGASYILRNIFDRVNGAPDREPLPTVEK